jgi:alkanesulfonate monooxygenase SsuD/methylene tetrahydromethanopterin reductase-like flavin-dependent oxidoreductase (luciferase family)
VSIGLHLKDPRIDDVRVFARRTQDAGFSHLFFPELSVTSAGPATGRDPFVASSVALEVSTSLIVGTGVVGTIFHTTHHLALTAATLAEQSGGRFVLGVGVAHREFADRVGVAFPPRVVSHAREACSDLRARSREGVAFGSGFPVWLAALGPRMVDVALDAADGAMLNWVSPDAARSVARSAEGLDRAWSLSAMVRVGPRAVLEEDAARYRSMFANYATHFARQGLATPRAVVDGTCLPTEGLEYLDELAAAYAEAGVDVLILNPSGMDRSDIEAMVDAVGRIPTA